MANNRAQINKFREIIWDYYRAHKRDLPWRKTRDPYRILVSEIMLQQTQVERVKKYYAEFLKRFPGWPALAKAPLKKVLSAWQGMGYNRRAVYLKRIAETVVREHKGKLPKDIESLVALPGIGRNTAAAILSYAYNIPHPFIETNIRRTFIHHFFKNKPSVHDKDILPLVEQALDRENPREWHWALMDYGTMLAAEEKENPNRRSAHYVVQSKFEGSRRQLRGLILKLLLRSPHTLEALARETKKRKTDLEPVLGTLLRENFIRKRRGDYEIF